MSRTQRLAFLAVAALIAVVAFVALRPSDDGQTTAETTTTATQTDAPATTATGDAPPPAAEPTPKPPKPPLLRAGRERTLTFRKGDTVRFRVRHPTAEEVHVHGYDRSKDLPAGKTVTMSFKANLEGIFEIELEHSGTPIGNLKVEP